jgi:ribonucleotide reductase alpha subunit
MVKYDDVKDLSTEEYFNGNNFSIDIFNKKYSLNGETYVQTLKRVCDYIASAEDTEEKRKYWSDRWFDEIFNDWWHPAGSIMQGANSGKKISMANCTTISLGVNDEDSEWDNLESIYKNTAYTVAKTAAYRQGLGIDFSRIRPQGLNVLNSSKESQGVIHWMKFIDSIGNFIGQSGRTPAMLMSLNISHPDIENFITVKSDYTKIQNANISVQITNDFMESVKTNSNWKLIFEIPEVKVGDKVYVDVHSTDMDCLKDDSGKYYKIATKNRPYEKIEKEVNAKELLELLAKNMLQNAEPGVQFIDMAKYWSNSDYLYEENVEYDPRIISTNACSEQYLSRESLCVLASINCGKFSTNNYEEELSIIAPSVNRFLDNVNEMEVRDTTYATPHQRVAIQALRRTGAGVTNLSGWLFKNNAEYGSKEGNELLEKFNERYNYFLYKSSIELGEEKGSFGMFSEEKYTRSPFIQNLMKKGLKFKTMRNVTCSSVAPAGCIEENTRIVTDMGLVKIKDLIPTDKIPLEKQFSYDFPETIVTNENTKTKVTAFYNNGVVDGYCMVLEDGRSIKTSETHRIRILREGKYEWEYVPNINIGDIVVVEDGVDHGPTDYVKLNNTLVSTYHSNSEVTLPNVLDESLAEFLGLFTGDGSIKFRSENGNPDAIRFPIFGEDLDLIDWVVNFVKNKFGLKANVTKSNRSNMYEIYIHSKNLCDFIINNGFAKKTTITKNVHSKEHIYHIPELIFRSPKTVIAAYIRGLFEADGSITKDGMVTFATKHYHVATEVQELLTYIGIQSKVDTTVRKENSGSYSKNNIHRVSIRYKSSFLEYANSVKFLSNRKNIRLSNKLNSSGIKLNYETIYMLESTLREYREIIRQKFGCKDNLYVRLTSKLSSKEHSENGIIFINRDLLREIYSVVGCDLPFDFEKYATLKVKSVSRELMQTYDIEVSDDSHTYITSNGVVNHNTLSTMFRDFVMSYGVEPAFGLYFWKRTRISGQYEYYFCVPNVVREYFKQSGYEIPMTVDCLKDTWDGSLGSPIAKFIDETREKLEIKFKTATEVQVQDKLDLMSRLMKDVDSSISVTYTLPEGSTWKDTYDLIVGAYEKGVKSIAAFPDKKMYGIISFIPFRDLAVKLTKENVAIYDGNLSEEEKKDLGIVKAGSQKSFSSDAPKRNKTLDQDVYVVTSKGKKYIISVGKQDGKLYEIFGGLIPENLSFKFTHKHGKMTKVSQGHYTLEIGDDIVVNNFGEIFTAEEQMLFRMISTSLRHGIPVKFIVQQMAKSAEDMSSLTSVVSRVLKKYIQDGETANGMKCPVCSSKELIYGDGCVSCSCGWSRCS